MTVAAIVRRGEDKWRRHESQGVTLLRGKVQTAGDRDLIAVFTREGVRSPTDVFDRLRDPESADPAEIVLHHLTAFVRLCDLERL